jgi:hypothetical protein
VDKAGGGLGEAGGEVASIALSSPSISFPFRLTTFVFAAKVPVGRNFRRVCCGSSESRLGRIDELFTGLLYDLDGPAIPGLRAVGRWANVDMGFARLDSVGVALPGLKSELGTLACREVN